ncbi:MAG: acyltransferase [Pusillimonas sp.]|nr:acyltransferase [Pusillimonas sp.]
MKESQVLGHYASGRDNNFNLLRMLAAIGVLVSHAYPISLGAEAQEPLEGFLDGITLGGLSVLIFFSISGFFITKSFVFSVSWQRFLVARALRLFPALFVVLTVTIVFAGVFMTTVPHEFWSAAPGYLLRNLTLVKLEHSLPGVFDGNPYGTAINGSLWTLFYEVICYAGIFVGGILGILHRPRLFALSLGVVVLLCLIMPYLPVHSRLQSLSKLALPFAIGAGLFLWRDLIPLSLLAVAILALLTWGLHGTEAFRPVFVLTLSYSVFVLGYWPSVSFQNYNRLGDYSYGTYIYAFPVQQLVASSGVADPLINMAIALPITLICAALSWHLIERVALEFKPRSSTASARQAHDQRLQFQDERGL